MSRGLKILIIDDDDSVRAYIKKIIKRSYVAPVITEAESGLEGRSKVDVLRPDLIIMDLRIPGVDGFALCQQIRNEKKLDDIRILAISGIDLDDTRKRALDSGASDFMGKPFESHEILEKIESLLTGK